MMQIYDGERGFAGPCFAYVEAHMPSAVQSGADPRRFAGAVGNMPSRLMASVPTRLALLRIAVAVAFGSGMLLSPKLWFAQRDVPLVPVAGWLPNMVAPWDQLWWLALLMSLAAIAIVPRSSWPSRVFLLLLLPLLALDQLRWQPWVYQYLVMLAVLSLPSAGPVPSEADNSPLNACRLILCMTYIFSGLQKFNASFPENVGSWLLCPVQDVFELHPFPGSQLLVAAVIWMRNHAWILAATETAIGVGLLIPQTRTLSVVLAAGMHLLVLFVLGPLGYNFNSVVWPWNAAMIVFVFILFLGSRARPWQVQWPGRSAAHWLAAVLFGLLPVLNFWNYWDSYLSSALYSGNTLTAEVELRENLYEKLPASAQKHCSRGNGVYRPLDLEGWSMGELNVPLVPERRIYLSIALQLGTGASQPDDCVLLIKERPHFTSMQRQITRIDCGR
jgi:hypothetical protein